MTRARNAPWVVGLALACATAGPPAAPDPMRYRLAGSGTHWDRVGDDAVLDDLRPRYPEFFAHALDPSRTAEDDLLDLREDLERTPTSRHNYDALNALAIGYFEINYRAEAQRGEGVAYMSRSFRTAKLAAVPWRAYGEVEDPRLRDAILDFFQDAALGEKLGARSTGLRLLRVVESLERKESDPERLERIRDLVARLRERERELLRERPAPEPAWNPPVGDGRDRGYTSHRWRGSSTQSAALRARPSGRAAWSWRARRP